MTSSQYDSSNYSPKALILARLAGDIARAQERMERLQSADHFRPELREAFDRAWAAYEEAERA